MGNCNVRISNGGGATLPKVARILIADDHALVREALTSMLQEKTVRLRLSARLLWRLVSLSARAFACTS
jgi:hypothetical protein